LYTHKYSIDSIALWFKLFLQTRAEVHFL
jgi:hypothetical protein